MQVSFVLPAYFSGPIGGYRIVYQYANALAHLGHDVTVVLPRTLRGSPPRIRDFVRGKVWTAVTRLRNRPLVGWQWIDPRVKLRLVAQLDPNSIPDGDAVIATAWQTATPVMRLPQRHGRKFYLIQHYETWAGPKEQVDATWGFDMTVVAISRWLLELGRSLGARNIIHIPNAIDHERFKVISPPATRPQHIISLYHSEKFKGVADALAVLERFHVSHPEVKVTMFGTGRRGDDMPAWIEYFRRPSQDFLVTEIYNTGTIYLGASLAEGWALPPAEAMACGCAFVGTDIGGFRDYAEDGLTALLSPSGDRDALYSNLCRMVDDSMLRHRICGNGTASIRNFTWARSGKALEEALSDPSRLAVSENQDGADAASDMARAEARC